MRIIYLYDIDGWALHSIGDWLARSLGGGGVDIRVMAYDAWHAQPASCDVLYLSYSGLVEPKFDYRRYASRVVSTIHDPCELSFFEHRDDWAQLPLGALPIDQLDALSVISAELRGVLQQRYQVDPILTPTWSPRCEVLRNARLARGNAPDPLVAMSSTNVPVRRPLNEIVYRLKHPGPFFRDERGRISLSKLATLFERRRRKRVEWLTQIAETLSDQSGIRCAFTVGEAARRSRDEYEAALLRADVYVCTSTMEGGPLPVLEAVMAGAAVLSTRVGQVPRWMEDGESGFVCASPEEFVARLRAYDADRPLLRRHQARARAIADALAPDLSSWRKLLAIP